MIKKEYETKSGKPIRLWLGDCMDLMSGKPENHWDLAIVDPPYGIGVNHNMGRRRGDKKSDYKPAVWDNEPPSEKYFKEVFRASKNHIVWGANHFMDLIANRSSCWIVWDKGFSNEVSFASAELAYTSFDSVVRRCKISSARKNGIHPTQKPVKLYRWLLTNYANEDDTILDTHGGSMSLAIACYIEDFELDIIELDEDYYNDAVKRFEHHISQTTLF